MKIKLIILTLMLIATSLIKAQTTYCTSDNRFTYDYYFDELKIKKSTGIFALANHLYCNDDPNQTQKLRFDVYYPEENETNPLPKRPFILMIFGGGFYTGNRASCEGYCREFARRGFVAATIDYRLGKDNPNINQCACNETLSHERAVYRALQDAHAAMRYFVHNANEYKIDTNALFVGGYSAGAVTALNLVYTTQADSNLYFPSITQELGDINSSGNSLTDTFTIKGVFNNWGGVSSYNYSPQRSVPIISFHGEKDMVVPIDMSNDSTCDGITAYSIYGSRALHKLLTKNGICNKLSIKRNGGHGVWDNDAINLSKRVGAAACFFKSLACNTCTSSMKIYTNNLNNYECNNDGTNFPSTANDLESDSYEKKIINQSDIKIFPIPVRDEVNISITDKKSSIVIFDWSGRTVYESESLKETWRINTVDWKKGFYIVKIKTDDGKQYNKVFVLEQ